MSKLSIEERAAKYLKDNNASEVFGSSDGFLFSRKQDALAHAKGLKEKDVKPFGKASKEFPVQDRKQVKFLDQSVPKIKKGLAKITDVLVVEAYLAEEKQAAEPRTTAVDVLEERIAELKKSE